MNNNDLPYQLALTRVPHVGPVHARLLALSFPSAKAIFDAPRRHLEKLDGIGTVRAASIKQFNDFSAMDDTIAWYEKYGIRMLFITDAAFPKKLAQCPDCPVVIFVKGNADLNAGRILSVVGTRNISGYGREQCAHFIAQLPDDVLVVSGLAAGIDTVAHTEALRRGLNTIGIMAHGHDRIYPYENKNLARKMTEQGALVSEFPVGTNPDRENFPQRNRIVAGICDALLVVETGESGGSMITADLANDYNRDVFAIPGRATDVRSSGCNMLIRTNKAQLVTEPGHIIENMQWGAKPARPAVLQQQLFAILNEEEQAIFNLLQANTLHIDQIRISGITPGKMAGLLLQLELKGCIEALPGKMYRWK